MALRLPNGSVLGLLTPSESAEYLACSERQLRNYVAAGLQSVRCANGHRRFRVEDLRAWVDHHLVLESASTRSTATSTNSASPPLESGTKDRLATETIKRLRMRLTGSTPKRSAASGRRNAERSNVLPLRRT